MTENELQERSKELSEIFVHSLNLSKEIPPYVYDEALNRSGKFYNWGVNNDEPSFLLDLYKKSAKHAAIVNTKAQMIAGNGFDDFKLPDLVKEFLRNLQGKESANDFVFKNAMDLVIYGGFALNIIWSNDRQTIASINHIDVYNIRIAEEEETDKTENYYISDDWSNLRKNPKTWVQGFTTDIRKDKSISPTQILFVKCYSPLQMRYPQPKYISGLNWIKLEYEISNFHLSGVENQFASNLAINFFGTPNKEELDVRIKKLKEEYEGSKNAGKTMFTVSPNKDTATQFTPLPPNTSDQRYIMLDSNVTQGILISHQVTNPKLFGVKTAGELGGNNDLLSDLKVFQTQFITPLQRIIESTFTRLANINGLNTKIELNQYELELDVEVSVGDILAILNSGLEREQQLNILIQLGYKEDAASKLVKKIIDTNGTTN